MHAVMDLIWVARVLLGRTRTRDNADGPALGAASRGRIRRERNALQHAGESSYRRCAVHGRLALELERGR